MSDNQVDRAAELGPELRAIKLEGGASPAGAGADHTAQVKVEDDGRTPTPVHMPARVKSRSKSQSPAKQPPSDASTPRTDAQEEMLGGEITLKMEPGKAPKLSRTASQKIVTRPPPLYLDLPDATQEAVSSFDVLTKCTYANKHIGTTEHALECDCPEEWGKLRTPSSKHAPPIGPANNGHRPQGTSQQCLRRRLGLHQPCYQNGVCR
jgi:histone-lysine N-methyltransferase SETD2